MLFSARARRSAPRVARVLIIKWSALGDLAIASAAMEDIRRACPDAILHLNILPAASRSFRDDPRFERLLVVGVRARTQRCRRHL
jgi:ADP-heptose:LPS heptosyltransferase